MQTQQPTINMAVPDEVQKATEKCRDNLVILQADVASHSRIKGSLERDIVQAKESLNYVESLIKKASAIKQEIEDDVVLLKKEKTMFINSKKDREAVAEAEIKKIDNIKENLNSLRLEIEEKEIKSNDRMIELDNREKTLSIKEKELNDREEKIKELVKAL